jgi:hypothetical protein
MYSEGKKKSKVLLEKHHNKKEKMYTIEKREVN